MQPRRAPPRACRTSHRWPLVCTALTFYSTWPYAQPLPADQPVALKLTLEIARAVDVLTHSGEPLHLKLADALLPPPEPPPDTPLPLRFAVLLRSDPYAATDERRTLS